MSKLDFDLAGSGPVGGALALWKAKALLPSAVPSVVLVTALEHGGVGPTMCSKKLSGCATLFSLTTAALSSWCTAGL